MQMFGKFEENELRQVDLVKNTETLYYMRDDSGQLIGINKTLSSSIIVFLEDQQVTMVDYINNVDGILYPESELPEEDRKLKGFNWRGDERLTSVDDLFKDDPEYEPVRIEGIPDPEQEESFFKKEPGDKPLLNNKSRLKPQDLQERPRDTLAPVQAKAAQPEPLLEQEELENLPTQDTVQPASNQIPVPQKQQDTISPAVATQPKKE